MNIRLLSSVAGLALLGSTGVFAQNLPACQPGLVYGGCKTITIPLDTRVMGAPGTQADLTPYALGVATETLADGTIRQFSKAYPKTAEDHDGDGVPNKYDRFPGDPRFY